ncbi:hypothetical protein MP638_000557 [Amoeboaphelidium occidentale]|nr:hypothetical protein MP638_000557 [Amoeboaphelidium occidentale]
MLKRDERNLLFNPTAGTVELSMEDWNLYWPSVDNLWKLIKRSKKEWSLVCRLSRDGSQHKKRKTTLKSGICSASATVHFEKEKVRFQVLICHSHAMDLVDIYRRSSYVLQFARDELSRGYDVEAVMGLLKKKQAAYDYLGFKYISMSCLRSIQKRYGGRVEGDVAQENTVQLLVHKGYVVFTKILNGGRVAGFVNAVQLDMLQKYGNELIVMDSTEKTNCAGYNYVTAVIRTDERRWMPVFQFWVSAERSELYEVSLKWIQEKAGPLWKPSSFIIDGSRVEEKALVAAFGTSVKVYNCTWHSMQTLSTKVGQSSAVLELMRGAVYASTAQQCHEYLSEAIDACPYDEMKRYLQRAWSIERSIMWSVYSRRAGMVAEVITTNPVESLFSRLKKEILKFLDGLFDTWNQGKLKNSISCVTGVEQIHGTVKTWKINHQRLVMNEFVEAKKLVSEGKLDQLYVQAKPDGTCTCRFYRFNQMPCKHVLGRNIASMNTFVKDEQWIVLKEKFE